jgi:hypothetical protein
MSFYGFVFDVIPKFKSCRRRVMSVQTHARSLRVTARYAVAQSEVPRAQI